MAKRSQRRDRASRRSQPAPQQRITPRLVAIVAALVVLLVAVVVVFAQRQAAPPPTPTAEVLPSTRNYPVGTTPEGYPYKGNPDAKVTVVEYSDYQCPFCRRAEPTVSQLLTEYGDKIRFVYRDYPLQFHQRAMPASIAAHCGAEQGKYWQFHENLMKEQGDLSDDDLKKRATAIGLDGAKFAACFEAKKVQPAIDVAFKEGQSLGVTGTPSFFVNGRMIVGAKPIDEFKALIQEELDRAATQATAKK